jgi:hypothetical protein
VRRVGRLAYELDFPPVMNIHSLISVAHLSPPLNGRDPFSRAQPVFWYAASSQVGPLNSRCAGPGKVHAGGLQPYRHRPSGWAGFLSNVLRMGKEMVSDWRFSKSWHCGRLAGRDLAISDLMEWQSLRSLPVVIGYELQSF